MIELEVRESDGNREYKLPSGRWVPSVTTLLGAMEDQTGLEKWRDRIGHDAANKYTAVRARYGQDMHDMFEAYMEGRVGYMETAPIYPTMKEALLRVKDKLNKFNIHCQEEQFWSEKLGLAGRSDLVCYHYKGPSSFGDVHYSIVDFKSYRTPKEPKHLQKYFEQMAAYAIMGHECGKIPKMPKTLVLFAPCMDAPEPQIVEVKTRDYIKPLYTKVQQYWRHKENVYVEHELFNLRGASRSGDITCIS